MKLYILTLLPFFISCSTKQVKKKTLIKIKTNAEKKQAYIYFDWEKANAAFKNEGGKIDMQIKISKDNEIKILLNGESFEAESIWVFDWSPSMLFGNIYKNVN